MFARGEHDHVRCVAYFFGVKREVRHNSFHHPRFAGFVVGDDKVLRLDVHAGRRVAQCGFELVEIRRADFFRGVEFFGGIAGFSDFLNVHYDFPQTKVKINQTVVSKSCECADYKAFFATIKQDKLIPPLRKTLQ